MKKRRRNALDDDIEYIRRYQNGIAEAKERCNAVVENALIVSEEFVHFRPYRHGAANGRDIQVVYRVTPYSAQPNLQYSGPALDPVELNDPGKYLDISQSQGVTRSGKVRRGPYSESSHDFIVAKAWCLKPVFIIHLDKIYHAGIDREIIEMYKSQNVLLTLLHNTIYSSSQSLDCFGRWTISRHDIGIGIPLPMRSTTLQHMHYDSPRRHGWCRNHCTITSRHPHILSSILLADPSSFALDIQMVFTSLSKYIQIPDIAHLICLYLLDYCVL